MITASIVTYKNKPDVLVKAIESFLACELSGRLIVIDNSPTDIARSLCQHPKVEYFFSNKNIGYGRAHNLAIRKILDSSTYHLVLNPDVYFPPNVITELLKYLEDNKHVGLVMPKVLNTNGQLQPLCKLLPSPHHIAARRLLYPLEKVINHLNHEYEMRFTGYNQITEVPFLSGCFMMLRTNALKKVGLFDERFFLYFEDTDLSRRIHQHFQTVYYPQVSVYHLHERGPYKENKLLWCGFISAIQYFNKWGWILDKEREEINRRILVKHNVNGYRKKQN